MVSTFFIYADAPNLREIAEEIRERIEMFIAPYSGRVRLVDQREETAVHATATELQNWDLGINFEFDALAEVEKRDLVLFFQQLSAEFGIDFTLGGALEHGLAEEFLTISAAESLEPAIELLVR
jgi:hypothetical protein